MLPQSLPVAAKLPEVAVTGGGGHFSLEVISSAFEGKGLLAKQRLVYGALTELMAGEHAPVHAIDSLKTLVPE
ncbi:MAG: BolA family transcriptional regulator [Firmicutes bacterium]|nr:BolA family transcriptional regulator [Bacillota bacterium]